MKLVSAPGWALASMAVITIITQLIIIYDPSSFMRDFQVDSKPASQLIAFLLIIINGYDLIGALLDNWTMYRFSAASRVVGVLLFWSFGPGWRTLVWVEMSTLAILVTAMAFA